MVELYCFVVHAQRNATRTTNMREMSSGRNNMYVAGLDVTKNQQDRKTAAKRAQEGESEQEGEDNGKR